MVDGGVGVCLLFLCSCQSGAGVELEKDDVSILDNIVAALLPIFASSLKFKKIKIN